jgi:hypothetical protein
MRAEFAPADGFDFPFGDGEGGGSYTDLATGKRYAGWYKATRFAESYSLGIHTGEDWNGAGGGIGFHGWAREWEDDGPRHLSWGCVVLHLKDISNFYERLPEGAMVVIF